MNRYHVLIIVAVLVVAALVLQRDAAAKDRGGVTIPLPTGPTNGPASLLAGAFPVGGFTMAGIMGVTAPRCCLKS